MKTASDILLEAANLLEEEGKWTKGKYFALTSTGCVMCAHGAIAYCGNPKVKEKIDNKLQLEATGAAQRAATMGNAATRLETITEQHVSKFYGEVGVAHYKAVKVGLSFEYNDNPSVTQQDVVNKLREAALL